MAEKIEATYPLSMSAELEIDAPRARAARVHGPELAHGDGELLALPIALTDPRSDAADAIEAGARAQSTYEAALHAAPETRRALSDVDALSQILWERLGSH